MTRNRLSPPAQLLLLAVDGMGMRVRVGGAWRAVEGVGVEVGRHSLLAITQICLEICFKGPAPWPPGQSAHPAYPAAPPAVSAHSDGTKGSGCKTFKLPC